MSISWSAVAAVAATAVALHATASASIQFEDVSYNAIDRVASETWGVSAGDYNGDGWPDIFIGNHRNRSSLFRNNGDGTFSDVILQADADHQFITVRQFDHHLGVFSDVDNDGDDDIMVRQYEGRGDWYRLSLWSDEGYLRTAGSRLSSADGWEAELECNTGHPDWVWPQYGDLDGDGELEYRCIFLGRFDYISQPFYNHQDLAIEDFDGDLRQEVFGVLGGSFLDDAQSISPNRAEAFIQYTYDKGRSRARFRADPPVTFQVFHKGTNETVTLTGGSQRVNTVDISYSPVDGYWEVVGREITSNYIWERYKTAYIIATSDNEISDVELLDPLASSVPMKPRMMDFHNGEWRNRTWSFGFREEQFCVGVTAGDFDNDKDLDLYLACRGGISNIANRLYENDGNGFFTLVPDAGGGQGVLGVGLPSKAGTADNAATLDYDNDGFLDLIVANGRAVQPIRVGGPPVLLHNAGDNAAGDRNWLQLDLEGAAPNFDALGARVLATSGDTTQLRFQNGGFHRFSQNHQRIHFGLGEDTSVDIEITWPDGSTDIHNGLAVNKIYTVTQGEGASERIAGVVAKFAPPEAGDDCGEPIFLTDMDQELFLYRDDCTANRWHVRATGGSWGGTFSGRLTASGSTFVSAVDGFSVEPNDTLNGSGNEIEFNFLVAGNGIDGFSFDLDGDEACLSLAAPQRAEILVGPKHVPAATRGINPTTLQPCTAPVVAAFSVLPASASEGQSSIDVTVVLSGPLPQSASVRLATRAETATAGEDFYGIFRVLEFAPGEVTKTVSVTLVDDVSVEDVETFVARLFQAEGAAIANGEASLAIVDDDFGTPQVSIAPLVVNESDAVADVVVALSMASSATVSVALSTISASSPSSPQPGWATGGEDYYGLFRELVFAPGEVEKVVSITLVDNAEVEPDERFDIRLFRADGVAIATPLTSVTIIDDDAGRAVLSVAPQEIVESVGRAEVAVSLSMPVADTVTVKLSTVSQSSAQSPVSGWATPGTDYYGAFAPLVFSPGETTKTVFITLIDDLDAETVEKIDIRLFDASGASVETPRTPLTIIDDD